MANTPFFRVIDYPNVTGERPANISSVARCGPLQQPWQIPFIFAFIIASSALMESTYCPLSAFEVGTARRTGLAAAEDATGGAPLS